MLIHQIIRERRIEVGMAEADAAASVRYSIEDYRALERGEIELRLSTMMLLAHAMDTTVEVLFAHPEFDEAEEIEFVDGREARGAARPDPNVAEDD